jgi:DNA-binding winged helix-turn-helix (wHTH) protein
MDEASAPATEYRFLEWRYEPERRRLIGPDGDVRLKPLSDRLLRRLLDTPGTVLAREHLIEQVWTRREVNDEVLSRAIAELRALLGDDVREPRFVETLSKGGYRWVTPVTRVAASSGSESIPQGRTATASVAVRRRWIAAGICAALVLLGLAAGLYSRRPDGGVGDPAALAVGLLGARPLAADPRLEYDARFDGMGRVVYVRGDQRGDSSEVVLVDPATRAERVLWQDASSLRYPTPSPNGREVAVARRTEQACELWSVALVDLHRTRLGDCAPSIAGGLEWIGGGDALIYTGAAANAQHAPGLVLLDRRNGTHRVLTTPEFGEGAHVDPRLSSDRARLVYASKRDGEAQLWQTDWPQLAQRSALLKRVEPVYGHAFEPKGDALWVAGDLTLYRALHRLRNGGDPELIGGRGALSIDLAPNGAAVWSEAIYDADVWLRDGAAAPWTTIARSNRYESQPEFSADGSRLAVVSNRNGTESVLVVDRRDGSARPLPLNPAFRWVRPTWSVRDHSLIITAYEDRHTRLYRYRLDDDVPELVPHIEEGAFQGVELADRLVYMTGNGTGRGTLMQLRDGQTTPEDIGLGSVTAYRASQDWLVWRSGGSTALHVAPWPALRPVRDVSADDAGEAFTLAGNALYFLDQGILWMQSLPDGERIKLATERVPNGNGPSLAASSDGALAVVTLTSLSIDLMIADLSRKD